MLPKAVICSGNLGPHCGRRGKGAAVATIGPSSLLSLHVTVGWRLDVLSVKWRLLSHESRCLYMLNL